MEQPERCVAMNGYWVECIDMSESHLRDSGGARNYLGRIVGFARGDRLAEQNVDGLEILRPAALGALESLLEDTTQQKQR